MESNSCPINVDRKPLKIIILGSTGSIGESALAIVRCFPDRFKVEGLLAGSNAELLSRQVVEFKPAVAGLVQGEVPATLRNLEKKGEIAILTGLQAAVELVNETSFESAIGAIVGIAGLASSLRVLQKGKRLLLANKESLVCAGSLLLSAAEQYGGVIVPIDSEHSALAQLLELTRPTEIESLTLTASGGPFLNFSADQLNSITPEQAVKHPKWAMGAKISVDSSTMVNKALELVEAHWLFDCDEDRLEVLVHPQSIVHSLVTLVDGVQLAHLSVADMQGAISFAMQRPNNRLPRILKKLSLSDVGALSFLALDHKKFPAVSLIRQCLRNKGMDCVVFNAANEAAVALFLQKSLPWKAIVPTIEEALNRYAGVKGTTVEEIMELHHEVFQVVHSF
jgi:1-deoxy-D-xylulose-5-phosphate reductoisomerase